LSIPMSLRRKYIFWGIDVWGASVRIVIVIWSQNNLAPSDNLVEDILSSYLMQKWSHHYSWLSIVPCKYQN
jgi:hypothetical protein